jgi:rubrerythrin
MPDFGNPFAGLAANRKLTKPETIRAIRFLIAAEYEAVQLYVQLAESVDDNLTQAVLLDIADEEKVHAGEFLALLKTLDPEEESWYQRGEQEVSELKNSLLGVPSAETVETEKAEKTEKPALTVGNLLGQK